MISRLTKEDEDSSEDEDSAEDSGSALLELSASEDFASVSDEDGSSAADEEETSSLADEEDSLASAASLEEIPLLEESSLTLEDEDSTDDELCSSFALLLAEELSSPQAVNRVAQHKEISAIFFIALNI